AEILQQIAKGLSVSAESLYVRAGILDERVGDDPATGPDVLSAIAADRSLTDRQRSVLVEIYQSFVGEAKEKNPTANAPTPRPRRRTTPPREIPVAAPNVKQKEN
ncbi:MAG: transcriptional regulator, partial [Humibacillus sp.]